MCGWLGALRISCSADSLQGGSSSLAVFWVLQSLLELFTHPRHQRSPSASFVPPPPSSDFSLQEGAP